jgi:allophanate hydrolase subunit 1
MRVERGSVMIGGPQAGIMPCTAPSGWHIIGRTDISMFDPDRTPPAALMPGDRVRFRIAGILA